MKISYNVLKNYIKNIETPEQIAEKLIMHTAEVEKIIYEGKSLENIVYWKIQSVETHSNANSLKVCKVDIWENEDVQIVCGGSNLEINQKVAVAKIWAVVSWHWEETITMQKTRIRGIESFWMICASEEIWLAEDFPQKDEKEILDLSHIEAEIWNPLAWVLDKNNAILEVDNKAINHRPDLFSHIWIIREIYSISWKKFDFEYETYDFSSLKDLWIKNEIPEFVSRYLWIKVENVWNIESPKHIKEVLKSNEIASKWLLVDITNYSLYLYWQPTHCFDADKIDGNIIIRKAKTWEKFIALDNKEYELNEQDIVIADNSKILALGWIIWWKSSAVSDETKNIIIESANFDQANVRKTWKRLWVRTDSLNLFEKDLVNDLQDKAASLIIKELEKNLENIKVVSYTDSYPKKQEKVFVDFDLDFYNNLIWKKYEKEEALNILENLWITINKEKTFDDSLSSTEWQFLKLEIPFWRKDLNYKADIAEEIARISGYDNVKSTIPEINMWAVEQTNIYKLKIDAKNFLTDIWYFDLYTYSFINQKLMEKCLWNTKNLIAMKNALSEELSHLRCSLIPNLLQALEENSKEFENLKVFELEKVFEKSEKNVSEQYFLSWLEIIEKDIAYYEIQKTISDLFKKLWILKVDFKNGKDLPSFSHSGRTAEIIVRWKKVWFLWEINPKVANNFDINSKIWFFEIFVEKLDKALYWIIKAKDISQFQENNFDLNFVVDKENEAKKIKIAIEKIDKEIIKKVELIDIYEDKEKLPEKRSLTYKIFIQSMDWTLDDKVKWELIEKIITSVKKVWGELR